jgi:hypothetical protein
LFSTSGAAKRSLQRRIGAQARVDLNQAVGAGQDGDEGIKSGWIGLGV